MKIKYDWSDKETCGLIVEHDGREFAIQLTRFGEVAMSDCADIEKEDSQGWYSGEKHMHIPTDPTVAAVFEIFVGGEK